MKKWILIMCCIMTSFSLASCGNKETSKQDDKDISYEDEYASVINDYINFINGEDSSLELGIHLLSSDMKWLDKERCLTEYGYAYKDINEDGICELIIGWGNLSYAGSNELVFTSSIYSMVDGKLVLVFNDEDGDLSYVGENEFVYDCFGEEYFSLGKFKFNKNDITKKDWSKFYFTDIDNYDFEDGEAAGTFYYNTNGKCDENASWKMELDYNDYFDLENELLDMSEQKEGIMLTPLIDYAYGDNRKMTEASDCKVTLESAWDYRFVDTEFCNYEFSENFESIVVLGRDNVEDFKVLRLSHADSDVNGVTSYEITETMNTDSEKYDLPLFIQLEFMSDVPRVGFSYVEDGNTRYFAVAKVGEDEYLISEFFVE